MTLSLVGFPRAHSQAFSDIATIRPMWSSPYRTPSFSRRLEQFYQRAIPLVPKHNCQGCSRKRSSSRKMPIFYCKSPLKALRDLFEPPFVPEPKFTLFALKALRGEHPEGSR